MASKLPQIKTGSQSQCEKSCNLTYGISQTFSQNVIKQQKARPTQTNNPPQVFDDPNEQMKYNHLMGDDILTTFDDESEKKIFKKALEGMESNYPEILQGTEEHMFYCPTAFNFDSRIKATETSVPDVLEKLQHSLASKKNLTKIEQANLKAIRNHLTKLRPQLPNKNLWMH